jgi:SAM-dependent methyltransferase
MSHIKHYTNCPVCSSTDIKQALQVKDYTVSGEIFSIIECGSCSLRFTQNVPDASSIAPYYRSENYISHTNTSRGLINRMYQWVRKTTLKQKRRLIEKATGKNKGRILDVGSGTGALANEMKRQSWQVTGLEPDADARILAKELYSIDLKGMDQLSHLPANSFDAITLWHVMEHVHDLNTYIIQLKNLLKDDGRLFIAVPNYTSKDAAIYKEHWAAYDVPRHLYHFSPRSVQVLIEKHGLKLMHYKPMWFDSFYISMLSSKYKKGNTNLLAAFWNGFRSNLKAMSDVKKCSSVIYIVSK